MFSEMRHIFRPRAGEKPAFLAFRSSPTLIVFSVSFAIFTDIFLYAVIVPVLPFTLTSRIGVSEDQVQLWMSISLAIFAASLLLASPILGYIADRYQNRRIPMLFGLILLLGATVFLCFSRNEAMLVIGRILQGFSCAMTWTVGLALVVDSVEKKNIGQATGWTSIAQSIGVFSGPVLGGAVYHGGGYYPVFVMCFGILVIDIFLRLIIIEVKHARQWEASNEGRSSSRQVSQDPAVNFQNRSLLRWESPEATTRARETTRARSRSRSAGQRGLLDLVRKPRLLAALWGTLVEASVQTAFESTLPLFVSETFGWDSTGAGLIFLPIVIPTFLAPLVGKLGDRYGPKWLCTGGFLFATPFLISLRFVGNDTLGHKVMLCGLLAGVGSGLTFVFSPLMAEISWAVESESDLDNGSAAPYAQAYGLYNMAFSGGAIVGPLLGGLIRDHANFGTVGWSLGIITFVTAIVMHSWIGVGSRDWKRTKSETSQSTI